jgi:hypothetical protein
VTTLHNLIRATDPDIEDPASVGSDGLTIDTDFGPVDLVAIDRALNGERLRLTRGEHHYIAALIHAHLAHYPNYPRERN